MWGVGASSEFRREPFAGRCLVVVVIAGAIWVARRCLVAVVIAGAIWVAPTLTSSILKGQNLT